MTVSQFQSGKRQQAQRGVSLIEVLVVLVILTVGILTIIRLFPSGFFSIQSTGNAALANSLGGAAINLGQQDAQSLPEAILPDDLNPAAYSDNLGNAMDPAIAAAYSNYDPDDPNNLENARVVTNETVPVPTAVNGQSVYAVKYGPVLMPKDPGSDVTLLPSYFTVNSPNWSPLSGNSAPAAIAQVGTLPPVDTPQDTLVPGREQFMVDLAKQRIAVPYAPYTPTSDRATFTLPNGQSVRTAVSYSQKMVLTVSYFNFTSQTYGTFTRYLNVLPATPRDSANPFAPFDAASQTQSQAYIPDTYTSSGNYQGGWFDPTAQYQDSSVGTAGTSPTTGTIQWLSATLYRPYTGVLTGHSYSDVVSVTNYDPIQDDPYQFDLTAENFANANPGAIGFNPKAASGSGAQARKVQISYIVYRWDILREDHDIPALTGSSTFAVRTAVPNLLLAGSANPDNSINTGIAGSNSSMVIMDLDTGSILAPLPATSAQYDPTNLDKPINNEDLNGTSTDPAVINVSYSLGRLTFGSQVFPDGKAHRIRIFYTADLNWTVAVQKAPAYFGQVTPSGAVTGTTPLGASDFAVDSANAVVYFARCNANKTVEIDGTYTTSGSNSATQGFSDTVAVSPVLTSVGDSNVSVNLTDGTKVNQPVPAGALNLKITAVRGLSARSVVAWKERNVYKVHTVDTILNRTP